MSKRIIETNILPDFKKGDYYAGLINGAESIIKVLGGGEIKGHADKKKNSPVQLYLFLIIAIIIIILRKKGIIKPANGVGMTRLGGRSFGGGGRSFGGGSFGGGGAGGRY